MSRAPVYHVKLQVDSWDAESIEGTSFTIEKDIFTYSKTKANRVACECLRKVVDGHYTEDGVDLGNAKELFTALTESGDFRRAYELVRGLFDFKIDRGESGCSIQLTCELLVIGE